MTDSRKNQFSEYKGSFVNEELQGLIVYIDQLFKKEKNEDAKSLLSNVKAVVEWFDWFLSFFDKGKVPDFLDKANILKSFIRFGLKIKALKGQFKQFYIDGDKTDRKAHPVDQVCLQLLVKGMSILEKMPSNASELFPYLNMEGLLKEAESYFPELKKVDEKNIPNLESNEKDEAILSLFPSLLSMLEKIRKFSKTDKNEKFKLIYDLYSESCSLILPIVNKLPDLFSIYNLFKDTVEKSELNASLSLRSLIEQADDEIEYYKQVRDTLTNKGLIEHTKINENVIFFFKCMLSSQEHSVKIKGETFFASHSSNRVLNLRQYPNYRQSELYVVLANLRKYLESLAKANQEEEGITDFVDTVEKMITSIEDIISLFNRGKIPNLFQLMRLVFLQDEMTAHLMKIEYQFRRVILHATEKKDQAGTDKFISIYLDIILRVSEGFSELPKDIASMLPFLNLNGVIDPFVKMGFDRNKLAPLFEYVRDYKNYLPTIGMVADYLHEFKHLSEDKKNESFILRINDLIKKIEAELDVHAQIVSNEYQKCVNKDKTFDLDLYWKSQFLVLTLTKLRSLSQAESLHIQNYCLEESMRAYEPSEEVVQLRMEEERLKSSIAAAVSKANDLKVKFDAFGVELRKKEYLNKRILNYVDRYNAIRIRYEKDFFSADHTADALNKEATVAELYQYIGNHGFKSWNTDSSEALVKLLNEAKKFITAELDSLSQKSVLMQEEIRGQEEHKLALKTKYHEVCRELDVHYESRLAGVGKVVFDPSLSQGKVERCDVKNIVFADMKENLIKYIEQRNKSYFLRDIFGNAFAVIARFFGAKHFKSQYEKRNGFVQELVSEIDGFLKYNKMSCLKDKIQYGLTHFKPRAKEGSRRHSKSLQANLNEMNQAIQIQITP